jgi:threonine/homoserine/homoserine lactone efflux protein
MNPFDLLIRGVAAGLAISAPVGPVNVLCISRTLARGRMAGVVSGLGAAAADTIYGAIAAFSIHFVISFILREENQIRFYGGLLLIAIGIVYYFRRPASLKQERRKSTHSEYVTTFLLTLTNPTTVLSFLVVLAALGLGGEEPRVSGLLLVGGIFTGSMIWWTVLAAITNRFRRKFDDRAMLWMNRIGAFAICGFGVAVLIFGRTVK